MIKDPMDEIKAKAKASFAVRDAKRKVLIAKYQKAKTTKAQFKALAKLMRLHVPNGKNRECKKRATY